MTLRQRRIVAIFATMFFLVVAGALLGSAMYVHLTGGQPTAFGIILGGVVGAWVSFILGIFGRP